MEPIKPLTQLTIPELERAYGETQRWKGFPPLSDTEWLTLLNGLPPNIQFEFGLDDQGEPELRVRDSDFLNRYLFGFSFKDRSEALKRATLLAYLEHLDS